MQKTTNYDMFKKREDNRKSISQPHVRFLAELISRENKLIDYPIIVNRDMEVINGNHRLAAAKKLGVEIYYEIGENLTPNDIIISNSAKGWQTIDYLNYYMLNGYVEYLKFDQFMRKHNLSMSIVYNICVNKYRVIDGMSTSALFKMGKYTHPDDIESHTMDLFYKTMSMLRSVNDSKWTQNSRFWASLRRLFEYQKFDQARWFRNLEKLRGRCGPKAKEVEFLEMILEVYNYGCHNKLTPDMLTSPRAFQSKDHSTVSRRPTLCNNA